jgi:hypothetical protein
MKIRIYKADGKSLEVSGVALVTVSEGENCEVYLIDQFSFPPCTITTSGDGLRAKALGTAQMGIRDPALPDPFAGSALG